MAGYRAAAAAGRSIVDLLGSQFATMLPSGAGPTVLLGGVGDLANASTGAQASVTVHVHRVAVDSRIRPLPHRPSDGSPAAPELALELHVLVTAWDGSADRELEWLGLAAQVLHGAPVLSGPRLHASGDWSPTDAIEIVPESLTFSDTAQLFLSMGVVQRPSLAYVVRGLRLSAAAPVVAPLGVPR